MGTQGSNGTDYRLAGFAVPRPSNRRTNSDPPPNLSKTVLVAKDAREGSTGPHALSDEGSTSPGPSAGDSGTEGNLENSPLAVVEQASAKSPPSMRQRTAQACDKCRERKTKCSGHRPVCVRCTNRGLICEYSVRESRVRSVVKTRPVPPFQVNFPGAGGTGSGRPTPAYHSRLGGAQTNAFERTPTHAPAPVTGRYDSLLPAAPLLSPPLPPYKPPAVAVPSSTSMHSLAQVGRGLIIPRRELDAGQWDLSPSPSQSRSQASMNSSFEVSQAPPFNTNNSPYTSHSQARDQESTTYTYNYIGRYVTPEHLAHPAVSASGSGGMYDDMLPTDASAGDGLGHGDLSYQHFVTQVTDLLSIPDVLLTLFHSDTTSRPLLDSSQHPQHQSQHQQEHQPQTSGDRATQGGSGVPLQYPQDVGLSDMGHYATAGTTTKDGAAPGFRGASLRYDNTSNFASWDTSATATQADFGVEFSGVYEAYTAEKQQHQAQEMLTHTLRGYGEISSRQQHHHPPKARPPLPQSHSQDELDLMCSTPGMVISTGAYGVHSPHQQHVGAYPAMDDGLQHPGMFVPSNGDCSGLNAHYDALRVPIPVPDPGSRYDEFNFFK